MPVRITKLEDAWVKLYDDKAFRDRVLTVKGGKNIRNLGTAKSDNGKRGFNDKTSSVKHRIPEGHEVVLFDDKNYKDNTFVLRGTGKIVEISDLGSFSDKTSSLRWDENPG